MLRLFDPDQRREIVAHRLGEQKVGETVSIIEEIHELQTSSAQFVIFGVCEDIGIRANLGSPGAASAWNSFIPHLSIFRTISFYGETILSF